MITSVQSVEKAGLSLATITKSGNQEWGSLSHKRKMYDLEELTKKEIGYKFDKSEELPMTSEDIKELTEIPDWSFLDDELTQIIAVRQDGDFYFEWCLNSPSFLQKQLICLSECDIIIFGKQKRGAKKYGADHSDKC